jgi:3-oxoacyl-[acyl-carrier protein] reductase
VDYRIKGRRALVMGASRGLGRAIAEALLAEGVETAICARDASRLERTAKEIGATGIACDLSQPGAGAKLVADAAARLGGSIDILLVNTGGPPPASFDKLDDGQWRAGFESLWLSAVSPIRAALPGMRAGGWGRILLVTSMAAREPLPNLMMSNALRAGLHGMVNALSREIGADGITVNALMPGYTLTERLQEAGFKAEEVAKTVPLGRIGKPEEFAALACFLASEPAGYITGQAIACDGGMLRSI